MSTCRRVARAGWRRAPARPPGARPHPHAHASADQPPGGSHPATPHTLRCRSGCRSTTPRWRRCWRRRRRRASACALWAWSTSRPAPARWSCGGTPRWAGAGRLHGAGLRLDCASASRLGWGTLRHVLPAAPPAAAALQTPLVRAPPPPPPAAGPPLRPAVGLRQHHRLHHAGGCWLGPGLVEGRSPARLLAMPASPRWPASSRGACRRPRAHACACSGAAPTCPPPDLAPAALPLPPARARAALLGRVRHAAADCARPGRGRRGDRGRRVQRRAAPGRLPGRALVGRPAPRAPCAGTPPLGAARRAARLRGSRLQGSIRPASLPPARPPILARRALRAPRATTRFAVPLPRPLLDC